MVHYLHIYNIITNNLDLHLLYLTMENYNGYVIFYMNGSLYNEDNRTWTGKQHLDKV